MSMNLQAQIIRRVRETPDVVTLYFTVDGRPLDHTAGQYITVYFDETDIKQGKAYSLSSTPGDQYSSITVKKIGLFSGKLHGLRVGDRLTISRPYGFFYAHQDMPIIAIAAGVGIAPIWSIINHELRNKATNQTIKLFYTNKTADDIVFRGAIDDLAGRYNNVVKQYFTTRQIESPYIHRRLVVTSDIINASANSGFYVCGSQDFVSSIWRQLIEAGVHEDLISTETFFES